MTPSIEKKLSSVQTSLQLQLLLNWTARGLATGAVLSILFMILSKFAPLGIDVIRFSLSLLVTGAAVSAILALLKPVNMFDAAFACDIHLKLKERLTSAIEFSGQEASNPLIPALIKDAERHASRIRPGRDFPVKMPRELIYAFVLILITAGLYFVPPWQYTFASDEEREEYIAVQAEARNIRELAREITINPPPERTEFAEEISRELQELARDMEFGALTRREALERLSEIEERIDQELDESGYNDLREQLARIAQALGDSGSLGDASDALASGDAEAAQEALNRLAEDLESGRIPSENLSSLADALERAAAEMADNPDMAAARSNLSQAASELRAAAEASGAGTPGSENEMSPEEMAQALIDAIDRAIPEIQSLDVPQDIRDRATEMLEDIRDDLQEAIDSGEVTEQDVQDAQRRIEEVKEMLEEAGADLSGEPDNRTAEEIAQELLNEARNLENACRNAENLDAQTQQQLQSTCQSVAQDLQQQLSQGSCSQQSNADARQRLDEVREQLGQSGCTQQQMGQRTQCSGSQSQSGQQGSQQQGSQSCPGLSSLFSQNQGNQGQQGRQGQQGQQGQAGEAGEAGQCCGRAGASLKEAGQCLGQFGQNLNSGNRFNSIKQGIQASRSGMSGGRRSGSSGSGCTGTAESSWGTGTSPYAVSPSRNNSGHYSENSVDPNATPDGLRDYQELYTSGFKPGQDYDVQVEGQFSDQGGSYVFTEVVDPNTGETSYVPYFSLEPTDLTALMDAVEDQDIPRTYADFVRFYFEQLAAGSSGDSSSSDDTSPDE